MNSRRQLLLFDIDGTLLLSGRFVHEVFAAKASEALGRAASFEGVTFAGRSDRAIFANLHENSRSARELDAAWVEFRETYPTALAEVYPTAEGPHLLPGVEELLLRLADDPAVALALGTGNLRASAMIKLGRFGLDRHFPAGGFGDREFERPALLREGLGEARAHYGLAADAPRPWVIGDTAADVHAAKAIGAHCLAVCTFRPAEELVGADLIVEDLRELGAKLPWDAPQEHPVERARKPAEERTP